MCLADAQIMPGFLQSRNNWTTKHRPFSFVATFLVPGKHPLISPWLLLKTEFTQTAEQGLQEGEQLYSFLINTCSCDIVWLQKLNKSEVSLFRCPHVNPHCNCVQASETVESLASSRTQAHPTAGEVPESQSRCSLKNSCKEHSETQNVFLQLIDGEVQRKQFLHTHTHIYACT